LVLESGKVYGSGWQNFAQLGLGKLEPTEEMVCIQDKLPPEHAFAGKKVIKMACTSFQSFFLTDDLELYMCGLNSAHLFGIADDLNLTPVKIQVLKNQDKEPLQLTNLSGILFAATHTSFALAQNEPSKLKEQNEQQQQEQATKTSTAASSSSTSSHFYYMSNERDKHLLIVQPFDSRIVKVVCGNLHTVFLTENKLMYGIGSNKHHQLSFAQQDQLAQFQSNSEYIATGRIDTLVKNNRHWVRDIGAGASNTIFITEQGSLYLCGGTLAGDCGMVVDAKCTSHIIFKPVSTPLGQDLARVGRVFCGKYFTFLLGKSDTETNNKGLHTQAYCEVYGSGGNDACELGLPPVNSIRKFTYVDALTKFIIEHKNASYDLDSVACGTSHSILLFKINNAPLQVNALKMQQSKVYTNVIVETQNIYDDQQ